MAGETSAELTIVVRAQDAATRVINSIGRTIGRVLTAPLGIVAKSVAGIFKQFFSLKSLLVGGGIIGVIRSVVDGLSTSETKFRQVFSPETQRGINAVDDAFGKLGASIKATFGNVVGDQSGGIAGLLNGISDWLRDNQEGIRQFFRDLVSSFKDIATLFRSLQAGRFSLTDLLFGNGAPVRAGMERQRDFDLALAQFEKESRRVFGMKVGGGIEGVRGMNESGDPLMLQAAGQVIDVYENKLKDMKAALTGVARPMSDVNIEALAQAEALRAATEAMSGFQTSANQAADIVAVEVAPAVEKATEAVKELTPVIEEAMVSFREIAESIAGNFTDAFEDIIRGTVSVARAFGTMVANILGEIGRLLVYRSVLKALLSIGSSAAGGESGPSIVPTGNVIGSVPAYASGGSSPGGIARVGENGPENVFLPRGAHVSPSQRSRGQTGDVVNVYGARDARATAREVAAEMRRNRRLRGALA